MRILNEQHVGLYLKSRPLEELPANNGTLYKVNDVELDHIVDEYNAHFTSPEE
jgi:hypothetical protein